MYNWETDYGRCDKKWIDEYYTAILKEYDKVYEKPGCKQIFGKAIDKIVTPDTVYTIFFNEGGNINLITVSNESTRRFAIYDAT